MTISNNIQQIKHRIAEAEAASHRPANSVLLLAVSKQQPLEAIQEAFAEGLRDFGESYLQEAIVKISALRALPLCWHFIGPIQSNKAKSIAQYFDWVHSVNRYKIAQILQENRPADKAPLQVCIHINMEPEPSKSGIPPSEAIALARAISQMPNLRLRGLMTIPPASKTQAELFDLFSKLKLLMLDLNAKLGLAMDTLSMGMSDDLVPAIQAGATIVRIGRAIFGERQGALS